MLRNFFAREEGQSLVEYALVLILIAIAVIGMLAVLGANINGVFQRIANAMP
ncbi:MAG: Flp family type IVb pilin [Chloroflexi bacterium]|nr:Flp family type IVb pilin [Chloroflexota bacterium]